MAKEVNGLYEFGKYRLDAGNRALFRDGQSVHLPPKAVELLTILVERNGQVVAKEQLMELLWPDAIVEDANLTQNIFLLRKVFAEDEEGRKYIETIPRRGYRFVAEVRLTTPAVSIEKVDAVRTPKIIEKHTIARIITEEIEDTDELHPVITEVLPDATARKLLPGNGASLWQRRKLHIALLLFALLAGAVALFLYLNLHANQRSRRSPCCR